MLICSEIYYHDRESSFPAIILSSRIYDMKAIKSVALEISLLISGQSTSERKSQQATEMVNDQTSG
jgi:hypothetical protein